MNFDFSPEQKELGRTLRRMLERARTFELGHRIFDAGGDAASSLWREIAELGVLGAAIPEAHGGLGASHYELCVVAEELGRALAPTPFSASVGLAAEFLLAAGSEAQKQRWLPGVASGEQIGTFADEDDAATPVRLEAGRIHGCKRLVTYGERATFAVVRTADGLVLADLTAGGVGTRPVSSLDPGRPVADLVFDGAVADPLGEPQHMEAVIERVRDRAAVLLAFEQLGGADRALEMAQDYALMRKAFGRPIGSFQAIKHMLADMFVAATLARSNAYYAAWALSSGSDELGVAAAAARVSATRAFDRCAANNIQVHGGIGFTWAADPQLFYRRARALSLELGGLSHWEDRLIRNLDLQASA